MKNKILTRIVLLMIMLSLLVSPVSAETISMPVLDYEEGSVEWMAHTHPCGITFFTDPEHNNRILNESEFVLGQKVYYEMSGISFYVLDTVFITSSEITDEYFIYEGVLDVETDCVLTGDFYTDNAVDFKDASWLIRYCVGWKNTENWVIDENEKAGDFNWDGVINQKDVAALIRHLAGFHKSEGVIHTNFNVAQMIHS